MTSELDMKLPEDGRTGDAVPVIDISRFENGDDAVRTNIASEVSSALERTGFFVIKGHGFHPQVIPSLRDLCWQFFDLPLAEKLKSRKPIKGAWRGYVRLLWRMARRPAQFQGSNSSMWLAGCSVMRARTSASHAYGSTSFNLAVTRRP